MNEVESDDTVSQSCVVLLRGLLFIIMIIIKSLMELKRCSKMSTYMHMNQIKKSLP